MADLFGHGVQRVDALSLHQPWASLVLRGLKHQETRGRAAPDRLIGAPLAIHAAKLWGPHERTMLGGMVARFRDDFALLWSEAADMDPGRRNLPPLGVWLGVTCIVAQEQMTGEMVDALPPRERAMGNWREGRWAYTLGPVVRLPEPIAAPGRQSWFSTEDERLCQAADVLRWNMRHGEPGARDPRPTRIPVRYWTGFREGPGRESVTRTEAQLMGGRAVVWVDGQGSCIALSHVEAMPKVRA